MSIAPGTSPSGRRDSISVIVPVYRCSECLEELSTRLDSTLSALTDRYEILLVDDRSPDDAWHKISELAARQGAVSAIRLSRNFGQHIAITAGLAASRGDLAVVMDCDLQDTPELIADLHKKLSEGFDMVLARRVGRSHSLFRVWGARAYFWLLNRMSGEKLDGAYGCYSMVKRKVVDAYLTFQERERHYIFVLRRLGFQVGTIDYVHQPRRHGKSSYNLRRLLRHAVDGIFFQTTILLEWIVGLGFLFAAGGLIWAAVLGYRYLVGTPPPGFTTLAVVILVSTGVILTSLGVVGLYVGKIFENTKGRPLYIVDTTIPRLAPW